MQEHELQTSSVVMPTDGAFDLTVAVIVSAPGSISLDMKLGLLGIRLQQGASAARRRCRSSTGCYSKHQGTYFVRVHETIVPKAVSKSGDRQWAIGGELMANGETAEDPFVVVPADLEK